MGSAIAERLIKSGDFHASDILITDIDSKKTDKLAKLGATICENAEFVAKQADIVVLAVKPYAFKYLLNSISAYTNPLYISIAAGITIDYIKSFFSQNVRVIRAMPNTPALIGEGVTVVSYKHPATQQDESLACGIFEKVGMVQRMNEEYLDSIVALSGSSPAYVYIMIEAMADAAVSGGIDRNVAYKLAAQAVAGSAKMVLQTGLHPAVLKDNVCSPGGTTIKAVEMLEEKGFRSALISAMKECSKRSAQMSGK